jgi:addiction module HigA family antidote
MTNNGMRPVHPGEIIRYEYLQPLGMSVNALAQQLRVPGTRLHEIVKERRSISADTAMRLARFFGGDAQSWLNLQSAYDLRLAEINNAAEIREEVRPYRA